MANPLEDNVKSLVRLALNRETVRLSRRLAIVIAVDLSKPLGIVKSLERWLAFLEEQLDVVYSEHNEATEDSDLSVQEELTAAVEGRVIGYQRMLRRKSSLSSSASSGEAGDANAAAGSGGTGGGGGDASPGSAGDGEGQGVDGEGDESTGLSGRKLGVPIIVVGCQSDRLDTLFKDQKPILRDGYLDVMAGHLRKVCFDYSAGLVYTGAMHGPASDAINLKKLSSYLHHLLADTPLRDGPHPNLRLSFSALAESGEPVFDVFIPAGTDCEAAVDEMWEGNKVFGGDRTSADPYEAVIPRPKHEIDSASAAGGGFGGGGSGSITARPKAVKADIQAHSTTELFGEMETKLKAHLQELSGKPAEELAELYPDVGADGASSGSSAKPVAVAASTSSAGLGKSSSAMKLQHAASKLTTTSGGGEKKDGKPSAQDAQNYFQSLLNKKDGKKSSRSAAK